MSADAEQFGAADETSVGLGPVDETAVVEPIDYLETPAAWSQELPEHVDAEPRRWSEAWVRAASIAVACIAIAVGAAVMLATRGAAPAPAPVAAPAASAAALPPLPAAALPPTPQAPEPKIDGTYQIQKHPEQATYSGTGNPPHQPPTPPIWWAFRTTCNPNCIANGVALDGDTHTRPNPVDPGVDTLSYVNGEWNDMTPVDVPNPDLCGGGGRAEIRWELYPLPDGSFRGVDTRIVLTDGCGAKGNTTVTPFTATRIGPVPPGVLTAEIN